MATVSLAGAQTVRIRFMREVSNAREAVETCAKELQARIGAEFQKATTYAGPLARNTAAYNVRKALSGYDLRRGHRTGALQAAINSQRLYTISGSGKSWRIQFSDRNILSSVRHARYYVNQKVADGKIAGVRQSWLSACKKRLDELESRGFSLPRVRRGRSGAPLRPEVGLIRNLVRFITGE